MIRQSLHGNWQFRQAGSAEWLPATVPGCAHTDLLALGRIPDPFVGDNEKRVQWVAEADWEYRLLFRVDGDLLAAPSAWLVCAGLDTLAEVRLNGRLLGQAANMFRAYRWDVWRWLHPFVNELRIRFRSPAAFARERNQARPMPGERDYRLPGGSYLRKAPCHFGWDWGPKLPPSGIWREVALEGYGAARLAGVNVRQQHTAGRVTLIVEAAAEVFEAAALNVSVRLIDPAGAAQTAEGALPESAAPAAALAFSIPEPQLWWPNGYGAQPLYRVEVALLSEGETLDRRERLAGLRTIELCQEPDAWGRSFTFVVNGAPIFARGANWIPADSFPARVTAAHYACLLGAAAEAHHNMVRVWGGGYYEDDAFYDLCDRLGLLVWQDFMFACAGYPLHEPDFLENLKAEVVENVRRLRGRACLALWCGNNEMEQGWAQWGWDTPEAADLKAAYDRCFHGLLPEWIGAEDPDTAYWPSSPSSNTPFADPNGGAQGDLHQWAVWHGERPFAHYRETPARFVSEFGFQSLPALATVASYAEPEDWNLTSYVMEHHQRNPAGNRKIITTLADHFRLPGDFAELAYLTQVLQAECVRVGAEHWRRDPACSGALYWQLNDCWPVASWSSLDYYGRWKALHYASRRFFAPALLSLEDDGTCVGVYLTNDTAEAWAGEARWALETFAGERLAEGAAAAGCPPRATAQIAALDFSDRVDEENRRRVVFVCELWQGERPAQTAVATFAPDKHLLLPDPQIDWSVAVEGERLAITLQARSLARFVETALEGAEVVFSDNYFHLPAGRARRVTCPLPEGWTAGQAGAALRLRWVGKG